MLALASRPAYAVGACLIAVTLAACSGGGGDPGEETLRVYVSVPMRGESGAEGRAIADGARLALEQSGGEAAGRKVDAVFLDDTAGRGRRARWSPTAAAANARQATSDSTAIAYLGELESGATRASLPVTNEARLLQVSPASTAIGLTREAAGTNEAPERAQTTGERTFGRVIPDDAAQAAAAAGWAAELGATRVAVLSDDSAFGERVAGAFADAAVGRGVEVTLEAELGTGAARARVLRRTERSGAGAAYYGGTAAGLGGVAGLGGASASAAAAISELSTAAGGEVLASDALLDPPLVRELAAPSRAATRAQRSLRITSSAQDPSQLPPAGQRFLRDYRRRFDRRPERLAAYGYEAMAVVLDSIERAGSDGDDREAVIDSFLATADRASVLGTYSIDQVGNTALDRLAGYRVEDGQPVLDAALRSERR